MKVLPISSFDMVPVKKYLLEDSDGVCLMHGFRHSSEGKPYWVVVALVHETSSSTSVEVFRGKDMLKLSGYTPEFQAALLDFYDSLLKNQTAELQKAMPPIEDNCVEFVLKFRKDDPNIASTVEHVYSTFEAMIPEKIEDCSMSATGKNIKL